MIELVSVEVDNFRSFSHAELYPLGIGQGMTAVNGPNGSGKSSIATHAVLWALYGVTPDGVPVKALRRQESDGEVKAAVTFRHDGQTVCVTRSLRGKNDTTTAAITVDGVEQTSVSARTATAWVTNRLGVDAEGFITAFVVRQKEVDGLVRARPAERRALVERLAGIDRMSDAVKKAREVARTESALAASLTAGVDPDEAAEAAEAAETRADELAATADTAAATAEIVAQEAESARNAANAAETATHAVTQAMSDVAVTKEKLNAAQEAFDRVASAAAGADMLPDAQSAAARTSEERAATEDVVRAVDMAELVARQAHDKSVEASTSAHRAETAVEKARKALQDALTKQESLGYEPEMEKQAAEAQASANMSVALAGAARGESERLSRSIQMLESAASEEDACCPTCAQVLTAPQILLEQMRADRSAANETADAAQTEADRFAKEAERYLRLIRAYSDAEAAVVAARTRLAEAETAADDAATVAQRLEDEAETAAENAHSARIAAQEALDSLPALKTAEQRAQSALRKAEAAVEAEQNLPDARSRLDMAMVKHQEAVDLLRDAREALDGVDVDAVRSTATAAAVKAQKARDAAADARQEAALAERDARIARKEADDAAQQAAARKDALKRAETATATASALEEFRRDRIARLAPELSEVASDIVSVMTEGKYSSVDLDEDFTPVLTEAATGLERPVAWLSGGEESAVALALRVAIGEVVAGQRGGVLILDEVLTAHDKSRRAAVMSAIRALPRQIITINHVSEATDMVDLVAHVVSDGDGASTLETEAVGGPVEADLSDDTLDA